MNALKCLTMWAPRSYPSTTRASASLAILLLIALPSVALSDQSKPIRQLEAAVWEQITERALRSHGLTLENGDFDLRPPMVGDADEVHGAACA